ncbi:hypothetical protein Tco_0409971 [Tanacetum coccineum]
MAEAFMKTPSVLYQNYLREFWCTVVVKDPNPSTDDSKARPLKEFIIKFTMKNGQMPLTLDYKTFCESTGLDYNKGDYVAYPSTEVVKVELGKIAINEALVQRTLLIKTSFLVAWRMLTFVIQVLSGNQSSTEQLNSIQQLTIFSLLTGTKINIREIIFSDHMTRPMAKLRKRYISYPRFVSCALEVLMGSNYPNDPSFGNTPNILSKTNFIKDPSSVLQIELTAFMVDVINHENLVSSFPVSEKKGKKKSQTVTQPKPKSQGLEDFRALL